MATGAGPAGYIDIAIKAAIGGLLIAALLTLGRLRQYVVTGLLVSLPFISLYTWWWIGQEHGPASLRISVRAAMWSAIPWVAYLGVVYLLVGRVSLWVALAAGWFVWFILAFFFAIILQART